MNFVIETCIHLLDFIIIPESILCWHIFIISLHLSFVDIMTGRGTKFSCYATIQQPLFSNPTRLVFCCDHCWLICSNCSSCLLIRDICSNRGLAAACTSPAVSSRPALTTASSAAYHALCADFWACWSLALSSMLPTCCDTTDNFCRRQVWLCRIDSMTIGLLLSLGLPLDVLVSAAEGLCWHRLAATGVGGPTVHSIPLEPICGWAGLNTEFEWL